MDHKMEFKMARTENEESQLADMMKMLKKSLSAHYDGTLRIERGEGIISLIYDAPSGILSWNAHGNPIYVLSVQRFPNGDVFVSYDEEEILQDAKPQIMDYLEKNGGEAHFAKGLNDKI